MGCSPQPQPAVPAFYHWQTELQLDSVETAYLGHLQARRLYVKFFDLDWDAARQEAVPHAVLQAGGWPEGLDIVPTIFITNRTFQELPPANIGPLAEQVLVKVRELMPAGANWPEIQLDCDWSGTTKSAYFSFLEQIRAKLPAEVDLSATIRLHQYRYPEQTGVPPVDRGMLMFYNMGEVRSWEEPNSILNLKAARPYLEVDSYELPLDLALPLFRWGVLFRDRKMIKLINGLEAGDLRDTTFYRPLGEQRFELVKSTYLQGYYLYQGDEIRLEMIKPDELPAAARLLRSIKARQARYVAFYYLDRPVLESYTYAELEEVLEILSE